MTIDPSTPTNPHTSPFGRVVIDPTYTRPTAHRRTDRNDDMFHAILTDTLLAMVPLAIAEMQSWTPHRINAARRDAVDLLASHGDDLQFGGRRRGPALAALARAFAICAHADGGITALGIHACTHPHTNCPSNRHGGDRP